MQIIPLSAAESARSGGFTYKIISPYTDWLDKTSGTAYSILGSFGTAASPLGVNMVAGTYVSGAALNTTTAYVFAAGNLNISVGDDGSAARFIAATANNVKTLGWQNGTIANYPFLYLTVNTIDIVMTASAGTPATISAGVFELYLAIYDLNKIQLGYGN